MKQVPPEIIDTIIYVLSAAVGWLAKWLQSKKKIDQVKDENNVLKDELFRRDRRTPSNF